MVWLSLMLALASPSPLTVAVTPLTADKEREALAQAVTDYLSARLSESPSLRLVERQKLDAAFRELTLSASGLTGEQTLRLGKFVAADHLIVGSLSAPTPQRVVLTARLVNAQTGVVVKAAEASGNMEEVLALTDRLARDLLAGLNVKLEAKPAPTRIETVSDYRTAWLTGLGAFYTGQYPKAIAWLTRARRLEPQDPRIALLLARAYLAANEKEHAAVELRRLVRDFPNSAEAKEAEGLLKSSS